MAGPIPEGSKNYPFHECDYLYHNAKQLKWNGALMELICDSSHERPSERSQGWNKSKPSNTSSLEFLNFGTPAIGLVHRMRFSLFIAPKGCETTEHDGIQHLVEPADSSVPKEGLISHQYSNMNSELEETSSKMELEPAISEGHFPDLASLLEDDDGTTEVVLCEASLKLTDNCHPGRDMLYAFAGADFYCRQDCAWKATATYYSEVGQIAVKTQARPIEVRRIDPDRVRCFNVPFKSDHWVRLLGSFLMRRQAARKEAKALGNMPSPKIG